MAIQPGQVKRCVIYARLSRETEVSVSIKRQIEACEAEAQRRGWEVVGTFRDSGVSATKTAPADRDGWRALIESPLDFEAVLVWKMDRLARRITDFVRTNDALVARGAALAAAAEQIDMTTDAGQMQATMLAGFAQMEAGAMRDRQRAARKKLLKEGRYPGGALPYGFRAVPNPDGPGWAIAQDPEEAAVVRLIVERTLQGYTLHSTMQHLNELGTPTRSDAYRAKGKKTDHGARWSYSTVDHIVRQPAIAGMQWAPRPAGAPKYGPRDVLRDNDKLPVVNPHLAIITLSQWYALRDALAEPNARRRPAAMRRKSSAVLSGLMFCGDPRHPEPIRMYRGTVGTAESSRYAYVCPECRQTISNAESLILNTFFDLVRDSPDYYFGDAIEVNGDREAAVREASTRIDALVDYLKSGPVGDVAETVELLEKAKRDRDAALELPAEKRIIFREEWDDTPEKEFEHAEDDLQRQAVLTHFLDRIIVRRGQQGGKTDASKLARLEWVWRPGMEPIEPLTPAELDTIAGWTVAEGG